MTEIPTTYGPSCVSYDTVRRWKKKFESGVESIKMHRNQVGQNLQLHEMKGEHTSQNNAETPEQY